MLNGCFVLQLFPFHSQTHECDALTADAFLFYQEFFQRKGVRYVIYKHKLTNFCLGVSSNCSDDNLSVIKDGPDRLCYFEHDDHVLRQKVG